MNYLVDVGPLVRVTAVNSVDALLGALLPFGGAEGVPLPPEIWRIYRLDEKCRRVMEVIAA